MMMSQYNKFAKMTPLLIMMVVLVNFLENNVLCESYDRIKMSSISVDINKPVGYSIYRFHCFFTSCNYEFDPNDISAKIWDIVDDEVIVNRNLRDVYKNYGRNHLIPVLSTSRKNNIRHVVEIINVTLSRPMDSCSPFLLPKIIDSGWIMEKSLPGTEIKGLEHLLFKSGKECTPQILFSDKKMSNNYIYKINKTEESNLYRIQLYTRRYMFNHQCKEYYSCREFLSLILSHKPTGTYQMINITINIIANRQFVPYITSKFVNHIKIPLNTLQGSLVGKIDVDDLDNGFDGELIFVMNPSSYFYVSVFTGEIFTLQSVTTPINGHLMVNVSDRSCYIHSKILQIRINYSTVESIPMHKSPLETFNHPSSLIVNGQKQFYKAIKIYSDMPEGTYVISTAEYAYLMSNYSNYIAKIAILEDQVKNLFKIIDNSVVYYRGIDKNSQLLLPNTIIHMLLQFTVANSVIFIGNIYVMLHSSRVCLGALPKMTFTKPFQIVEVGNFDTRIAYNSEMKFIYDQFDHFVDITSKLNDNSVCFNTKYINMSIVDSYGSENFYINHNVGYISSRYPLYDPDTDYYILIQAVNYVCDSEISYKGYGLVKLKVKLKNNKYIPFFHNSTYIFNISEGLKPPSYVGSVRIRYADSIGYLYHNSRFFYYLKNDNTTISSYISVDRNSGVIILAKSVDRELIPQLKFGVIALNPIANETIETLVIINVDDEDDNPPVFFRKHVEINLEHNSGYIEHVLCIYASDKDDTKKFPLTYYIHSGPKNLFYLSPSTGVLSLISPLKSYVSNETISLHIRAKDTKHYDEMVVDILIEKSLDDRPMFNKFIHNISLPMDASVGMMIASFDILAQNDRIFYITCRFGRDITYTIASLFSIKFSKDSRACQLNLIRSLSYNDVKNILNHYNSFMLEVYDYKKNIMFPAQCLVNVILSHIDNRVVFNQKDYIFQHFDTISSGSSIGIVSAFNYYQNHDPIRYNLESYFHCDPPKNCSIDNLLSMFTIDKFTGEITNLQQLNIGYEDDITISAKNTQGSMVFVVCKIIVHSLSYKPMVSSIKPMEITLSESSPIGTGYTLSPSIPAYPFNINQHNITIEIVGGNYLEHFKIINNTITLVKPVDYETIQFYNIKYRWNMEYISSTTNATHVIYFENTIHLQVIDENDNAPIFPIEDSTFVIIHDLSVSRQYFTHFQAYDGDIDDKYRRITYKLVNSKVSIFIHPTLGIVSVTNDFTLFDRVMVLTVRAENDENPNLFALKNFSVIIVHNSIDDFSSSNNNVVSDNYRHEFSNMNIEFDVDGSPVQRFDRKITNDRPLYTIGRLFQNPLYGKYKFVCGDPYGFNNIISIDYQREKFSDTKENQYNSADLVYVYKVKKSVYKIQNIVAELKLFHVPILHCSNFNDDIYFLSNNNISQIIPKLSCSHPNSNRLMYTLVSGSRSDFNDNVLTLGAHSGIIYIHKLPELLFPIMEYFTYKIFDPVTSDYVFGRVSIQIININYDIKVSDLNVITVYVDSPVLDKQFIYNPRLSDGRTSVKYRFFYSIDYSNSDGNDRTIESWLTINSTNGHITAIRNYTLATTVHLTIRVTLLSPSGENITSTTQIIKLKPRPLLMIPVGDNLSHINYNFIVKENLISNPYGIYYVDKAPVLNKGIYHYECQNVSSNIIEFSNYSLCNHILFFDQDFYITPFLVDTVKHFKHTFNVNIKVCNRIIHTNSKCTFIWFTLTIIRPTTSAPYFTDCIKNSTIFVETFQPINIPLHEMYAVSSEFKDVFTCSIMNSNSYFITNEHDSRNCKISPSRYFNLSQKRQFIEHLIVDLHPHYLKYYSNTILQRSICSKIDLIVNNYVPVYNSYIDNYGVVMINDGYITNKSILCLSKSFIQSTYSIVYPPFQEYLTIDANSGCIYMLKAFNYSHISRMSLIVMELSFNANSRNVASNLFTCEPTSNHCAVYHSVNVIINCCCNKKLQPININYLNIPVNAPIGWHITNLNVYTDNNQYTITNDNRKYFYFTKICSNEKYQKYEKYEHIKHLPINIDPTTNSVVVVDDVKNVIKNNTIITNLKSETICINMVDNDRFQNSTIVTKNIQVNWVYVPFTVDQSSYTIVVPINQNPGIIGKINLNSLNPYDISLKLYFKNSSELFNTTFTVDNNFQIKLLQPLDKLLQEYNYTSLVDLELVISDNSMNPSYNATIPITIVVSHHWYNFSLYFMERNFTITFKELMQFEENSHIKQFQIISSNWQHLSSFDNVQLEFSDIYSVILIPYKSNYNYLSVLDVTSNGTLYKTVNNELLNNIMHHDQIYALDLRSSNGVIYDSIILQLVEIANIYQSKCIKFIKNPVMIVLHPTFKINQILASISVDIGCNRKNIQIEVNFEEFSDCFILSSSRGLKQHVQLSCDISILMHHLSQRKSVSFFVIGYEKKTLKKAYSRLIIDSSLLYHNWASFNVNDNNIIKSTFNITNDLKKDEIIFYVDSLKNQYSMDDVSYSLKCYHTISTVLLSCPFEINSKTGAITSKDDIEITTDNQYNLSVILRDNIHQYNIKNYLITVNIWANLKKYCRKINTTMPYVKISSIKNKIGQEIIKLSELDTKCYYVLDSTIELSHYFYLNPYSSVVYIATLLPIDQNIFKLAYFMVPELFNIKRDPSSRYMLTIELLNDDVKKVGFLKNKVIFKIKKTHPVFNNFNNSTPIGTLNLNTSKIDVFRENALNVRIVGNYESHYFLGIIDTNASSVVLFLRRKLPTYHQINTWNIILELYCMNDDGNIITDSVVDTTGPNMIQINVQNIPTTPPLLKAEIGQVFANKAFPQVAVEVEVVSPDNINPNHIVLSVETKLKSHVRFVRSVSNPSKIDIVIQSLWDTLSSTSTYTHFNVVLGYNNMDSVIDSRTNIFQQYTLYVMVFGRNSSFVLSKISSSAKQANSMDFVIATSYHINAIIPIQPSYKSDNVDKNKIELPLFYLNDDKSLLPTNFYYSNVTMLMEGRHNTSFTYFKADSLNSRLFVSLDIPSDNYLLIVERRAKNLKITDSISLNLSINRIDSQLFSDRENHIVLVLRFKDLSIYYTLSNMFIDPKKFENVVQTNCLKHSMRVFILSYHSSMTYSYKDIYIYMSAVYEATNMPVSRQILLSYLKNCRKTIEKSFSAEIILYDYDVCSAYKCPIGICVSSAEIDNTDTIFAFVKEDKNNMGLEIKSESFSTHPNYYIYPKVLQKSQCLDKSNYALTPRNCKNNGLILFYPVESSITNNNDSNFMCLCAQGLYGKYCESTTISFAENSPFPALYPSLRIGVETKISFSFITSLKDTILFLQSSLSRDNVLNFHFAVKLVNTSLVVEMLIQNHSSYPYSTLNDNMFENLTSIKLGSNLNDGQFHNVIIIKNNEKITVEIDKCRNNIHKEKLQYPTFFNYSLCRVSDVLMNENVNVHSSSLMLMIGIGFTGCIQNLMIDNVNIDFRSFIKPLPSHITVDKCLYEMKKCIKCRNGYCDQSHAPPYTCKCYDGWTGKYCDVRSNSFYIYSDGYMTFNYGLSQKKYIFVGEAEKSEYTLYFEMIPRIKLSAINTKHYNINNRILLYESNDNITEYSFIRIKDGYLEFVNNLGDGEFVVQFPYNFNSDIQHLCRSLKEEDSLSSKKIHGNNISISPFKNNFLKIIAKRYRNRATLEIPYLGKISRHYGVNNLLDTNRKIYIGNAPNHSHHHIFYNTMNNLSNCFASIVVNGITVVANDEHLTKYKSIVDCPCVKSNIICVGPSVCVASHLDYCGCRGYPGGYCGYLQIPFTIRYVTLVFFFGTTFFVFWCLIILFIYKNLSYRYFIFKQQKSPIKQPYTIPLLEQEENHSGVVDGLSSSYPPSLNQFNDFNVKNLMNELKHYNEDVIHYDTTDNQDEYKPTFKYYFNESDEDDINDEFKRLPPLNQKEPSHHSSVSETSMLLPSSNHPNNNPS